MKKNVTVTLLGLLIASINFLSCCSAVGISEEQIFSSSLIFENGEIVVDPEDEKNFKSPKKNKKINVFKLLVSFFYAIVTFVVFDYRVKNNKEKVSLIKKILFKLNITLMKFAVIFALALTLNLENIYPDPSDEFTMSVVLTIITEIGEYVIVYCIRNRNKDKNNNQAT